MEKMVTSDQKELKRFMLSSPESAVSDEERNAREAYRYCKVSEGISSFANAQSANTIRWCTAIGLESLDEIATGLL
jgi:hypothetical protein